MTCPSHHNVHLDFFLKFLLEDQAAYASLSDSLPTANSSTLWKKIKRSKNRKWQTEHKYCCWLENTRTEERMSRYQRFGVSRQQKSPVDKFLSAHYRCSVRPTRQWIIHVCIMPHLVTMVEHGIQKSGLARLASRLR